MCNCYVYFILSEKHHQTIKWQYINISQVAALFYGDSVDYAQPCHTLTSHLSIYNN